MWAIILILMFVIIVYLDKYKTVFKSINEINDIQEHMNARNQLMTYKLNVVGSTILILILLLYKIITWA